MKDNKLLKTSLVILTLATTVVSQTNVNVYAEEVVNDTQEETEIVNTENTDSLEDTEEESTDIQEESNTETTEANEVSEAETTPALENTSANEEIEPLSGTNNAGDFNVTGDYEKGWTYDSSTNTLTFNHNGDYTIEGNGQETEEQIHVAHGFWGTIIIENVNAKIMNVENTAKLTLYLDGTNTLREGLRFSNATTGTLTIDSMSNGSLTATGADFSSAGIGGGFCGAGNNIIINDGTVTATGGYNGAGIGGGSGRAGNDIIINNGTVTAISDKGDGIGGGYFGSASNIIIDGGSVKASMIRAVLTDNNGNPVYLAKLENQSGVNQVTVDDKVFTRQGDHPDGDGTFYLYLSGEAHTIIAGDKTYKVYWDSNKKSFKYQNIVPTITIEKTTSTSITVKPLENQDIYGTAEYKINEGQWQESNEFTGLNADTEYTVYARYQGNDMYVRSEAGTTTVTTMKDGNTLLEEKIPVNLKGIYEQKLSDVTIADGWTWVDKDTALSVGSQSYLARFDTTAYENEYDFTGVNGYDGANHYVEVNLTVSVSKANSTVTINTSSLDKKYDGTSVNNPDVEKTGSTKDVTFTWYQEDEDGWKELSSSPTNAGSYKVVANIKADDNYNGASAELEFTISQTANEWTEELSIEGWTYDEQPNSPTATSKYGEVVFTYSDSKDGTYTDTVPTNAGTYYVKATVDGTENYSGLEEIMSFEISKAVPEYSIPTDLTIEQGNPLSTIKLSKGFTWKDGTQKADKLGKQTFKAIYTPEDTNNYQTVETDITVNVVAKTPSKDETDDSKTEETNTSTQTNQMMWVSITTLSALLISALSILKLRKHK